MNGRRVLVAGGGTAGHVFPGLAVARVLRERGHDVRFLGTDVGQEVRLVPDAGFPLDTVPSRPLVRALSPAALEAPVALARAIGRTRAIAAAADVVLGMGGYASVPAVVAARLERRPAVIHEQNAVAGLANRLCARMARAVAVSFPDSRRWFPRRRRVVTTGNPVREVIRSVPGRRDVLAKEGREHLALEDGRRTVVLFGGSQGALHLNRAVTGAARLLGGRADLQLLVLTGRAHHAAVVSAMPSDTALRVRVVDFLERMELAYAVADLVVSRAGATTIAELTTCAVPALLVPYPYATAGHQEANARALQRAGGASVLLDDQVTSETLAARIEDLIGFEQRLAAMTAASRGFGRPDAAEALADLVLEVAG